MKKIYPSILAADFSKLGDEVCSLENAGADGVHIDVMDGRFVDNITFGMPVIRDIRKCSNLFFDVHLMIENPQKFIESFAKASCDLINFHYEATTDETLDVIKQIRSFNKKVGISIKPQTDVKLIEKYFDKVDMVLIMTVEPGFSGQKFMESCVGKIDFVKKHSPRNMLIQVDGGINDKTARLAKKAGANVLVSGNFVFKADDLNFAVNSLL